MTVRLYPYARPDGGFAVARETPDGQGRPVAVEIGARTYRTRREAADVAALCGVALFRSALCGGRRFPITP